MADSIKRYTVERSTTGVAGSGNSLGTLTGTITDITASVTPAITGASLAFNDTTPTPPRGFYYRLTGICTNPLPDPSDDGGLRFPFSVKFVPSVISGSARWAFNTVVLPDTNTAVVNVTTSVTDSTGRLIFVGHILNASCSLGVGGYTLRSATLSTAILVILNRDGTVAYAATINTNSSPTTNAQQGAWGVDVDASDNIYVTGNFREVCNFGNGFVLTSTNYTATQTPQYDIFLAKYSPSGACLFARRYGLPNTRVDFSDCIGRFVKVDSAGRIILACSVRDRCVFANITLPAGPYERIALVKFSADGLTALWATAFGGNIAGYLSNPYALELDANNNIYLSGLLPPDANPGGGSLTVSSGSPIFMASYSGVDGSYRANSQKVVGNSSNGTRAGIGIDQTTGAVYWGSEMYGPTNFGNGQSTTVSGPFLVAYNSSFTTQWVRSFYLDNTLANSQASIFDVVVDANSNVFCCGKFTGGSASLNPTQGTFENVWVASYTSSNAFRWGVPWIGASLIGSEKGTMGLSVDQSAGYLNCLAASIGTEDVGGISVTCDPSHTMAVAVQYRP